MMTREQLESLFRGKQTEDPWEKQISAFTIDQVDENRVEIYVERGVSAGRIPFGYTDKKTALDKLMLISEDRLLNAGMVLFCESLYAEVQLAIFAGKERLTFLDIQRERAPVFKLVQRLRDISQAIYDGEWSSMAPCSARRYRRFLWMQSGKLS